MEGYYRDILKKFKYDDTIDELNELYTYLRENNLDNIEDELDEINNISFSNCSFSVGDIMLPVPMGTNLFSIYDSIQSMNAIIPDVFKVCLMKEPEVYAHPVLSTRNSPKIKVIFEDQDAEGIAASIVTRYQRLIPTNIIKAFFYFGFKSNFENFEINDINFLEKKIERVVTNSSSNEASYSDPLTIFNEIYGTDTLIQNLIELDNNLNKVKSEKTDYTNFGNYKIPYLFTYYVIAEVLSGFSGFNVNKYSNLRDNKTTSVSYSDLVYLNFLRKLVKDNLALDNFLLLLNQNILGEKIDDSVINNLSNAINFIKENNIFLLIDYALEVKDYILRVISYNLNKKTYKIEKYAKPVYLLITKKLYCNYAKNSSYNYPELVVSDYCNNIGLD